MAPLITIPTVLIPLSPPSYVSPLLQTIVLTHSTTLSQLIAPTTHLQPSTMMDPLVAILIQAIVGFV